MERKKASEFDQIAQSFDQYEQGRSAAVISWTARRNLPLRPDGRAAFSEALRPNYAYAGRSPR